jgi:hypothetical protein
MRPHEAAATRKALKERRDRWLAYIHSLACEFAEQDGDHCRGRIEASHLVGGTARRYQPWIGNSVPLCSGHHRLNHYSVHNYGLPSVQKHFGVDLHERAVFLAQQFEDWAA